MVSDNMRNLLSLMQPPSEGGDSCDYRELIEVFGAGEVVGGISFGAPPRQGQPMDSGILRSRPSPSTSAVLMWGGSDVGESYYWLCDDTDPDRWTIVVDSGSGTRTDFDMGVVEFLVRMLSGLLGASLAIDMAGDSHKFVGWREAERELLAGIDADEFDFE
ncbi:MAG: hypothetical protein AUG49_06015 [Catenulispora sp. 13_1_20CM_3_70_7]|nr:MAG: hypothetical protein AUG49_06015 [Catenulispora sp. 13_1_20CM_3_70_7]